MMEDDTRRSGTPEQHKIVKVDGVEKQSAADSQARVAEQGENRSHGEGKKPKDAPNIIDEKKQVVAEKSPGREEEVESTSPGGGVQGAAGDKKGRIFGLPRDHLEMLRLGIDGVDFEKIYPPEDDNLYEELGPNARVYKMYNDLMSRRDAEFVNEGRDSTDTSQALGDDSSAVMVALMAEMVQLQRASLNSTIPLSSIKTASVSPSQTDVWVNGMWFFSLSLSLSAALLSVLVKQWLHQYTLIHAKDAREKAHIRHFRYQGMAKWHVRGIMGLIPLLLHVAVFLFLGGMVVFLFPLNGAIAFVVLLVTSALGCFYFVSSLLPLWRIQCPFRTPTCDIIHSVVYRSLFEVPLQLIPLLLPYHSYMDNKFQKYLRPSFDWLKEHFPKSSLREVEHNWVTSRETACALDVDLLNELMDMTVHPSIGYLALQATSALPLMADTMSNVEILDEKIANYEIINPTDQLEMAVSGESMEMSAMHLLCGRNWNRLDWLNSLHAFEVADYGKMAHPGIVIPQLSYSGHMKVSCLYWLLPLLIDLPSLSFKLPYAVWMRIFDGIKTLPDDKRTETEQLLVIYWLRLSAPREQLRFIDNIAWSNELITPLEALMHYFTPDSNHHVVQEYAGKYGLIHRLFSSITWFSQHVNSLERLFAKHFLHGDFDRKDLRRALLDNHKEEATSNPALAPLYARFAVALVGYPITLELFRSITLSTEDVSSGFVSSYTVALYSLPEGYSTRLAARRGLKLYEYGETLEAAGVHWSNWEQATTMTLMQFADKYSAWLFQSPERILYACCIESVRWSDYSLLDEHPNSPLWPGCSERLKDLFEFFEDVNPMFDDPILAYLKQRYWWWSSQDRDEYISYITEGLDGKKNVDPTSASDAPLADATTASHLIYQPSAMSTDELVTNRSSLSRSEQSV